MRVFTCGGFSLRFFSCPVVGCARSQDTVTLAIPRGIASASSAMTQRPQSASSSVPRWSPRAQQAAKGSRCHKSSQSDSGTPRLHPKAISALESLALKANRAAAAASKAASLAQLAAEALALSRSCQQEAVAASWRCKDAVLSPLQRVAAHEHALAKQRSVKGFTLIAQETILAAEAAAATSAVATRAAKLAEEKLRDLKLELGHYWRRGSDVSWHVAEEKSLETMRCEALKHAQRENSRPFSARPPLALPVAHETVPSPPRPGSSSQRVHTERHVRHLQDGSDATRQHGSAVTLGTSRPGSCSGDARSRSDARPHSDAQGEGGFVLRSTWANCYVPLEEPQLVALRALLETVAIEESDMIDLASALRRGTLRDGTIEDLIVKAEELAGEIEPAGEMRKQVALECLLERHWVLVLLRMEAWQR